MHHLYPIRQPPKQTFSLYSRLISHHNKPAKGMMSGHDQTANYAQGIHGRSIVTKHFASYSCNSSICALYTTIHILRYIHINCWILHRTHWLLLLTRRQIDPSNCFSLIWIFRKIPFVQCKSRTKSHPLLYILHRPCNRRRRHIHPYILVT